jgi:hypothetical protein
MLPKNKLRERRLERLRIFEGEKLGVFRHNVLKRWEDGTLAPAAKARPLSHVHGEAKGKTVEKKA